MTEPRACCVERPVTVFRVECSDGAVLVCPACEDHEVELGATLDGMGAVTRSEPVPLVHWNTDGPMFVPASFMTKEYVEMARRASVIGERLMANWAATRPRLPWWRRAARWPGARWDRFRWATLPRWLGYERDW